MAIKLPKGTRDFYPEEMAIQNWIFEEWKRTCQAFGFREYESAAFEHLDLYTQKSGEEIVGQLYNFTDKGGREIALRPEMTPTLARMVNQKGPSLKLPIRWFSIPRLWRYERAQRGRLREFFQLNMDILGANTIWAEIDLITAVISMLKNFGLGADDFYVGISSRKLLLQILRALGVEENQDPAVLAALDKRAKIPPEQFLTLLEGAKISRESALKIEELFRSASLEQLQNLSDSESYREAFAEIKELLDSLEAIGLKDFIRFDLSIVRGLAYYTGIVFEVLDCQGELRAIAGGGRYDNLLKALGGQDVSGVGFGIGDVVLSEMLKDKNLLPKTLFRLDYYLVSFQNLSSELIALAQKLREKGKSVAYSLKAAKLKKQLSEAEEMGAKRVLFFASENAPEGHFEVKNLDTRTQEVLPYDQL